MKKLVSLLLAAMMVLSLVACGKSSKTPTTKPDGGNTQTPCTYQPF